MFTIQSSRLYSATVFFSINEFLFIDFAKVHTYFFASCFLLLLLLTCVFLCLCCCFDFSHLKQYTNFDEALVFKPEQQQQ